MLPIICQCYLLLSVIITYEITEESARRICKIHLREIINMQVLESKNSENQTSKNLARIIRKCQSLTSKTASSQTSENAAVGLQKFKRKTA